MPPFLRLSLHEGLTECEDEICLKTAFRDFLAKVLSGELEDEENDRRVLPENADGELEDSPRILQNSLRLMKYILELVEVTDIELDELILALENELGVEHPLIVLLRGAM